MRARRWLMTMSLGAASAVVARADARADEPGVPAPPASTTPPVTKQHDWDFGLLPLLSYAPETSLAAGGGIVIYDNAPSPPGRPRRDDELALFAGGTLRKQFIANVETLKYWNQDRHRLSIEVAVTRFPNFFWGVGNTTAEAAQNLYTQSLYGFRASYAVRAVEEVYVGPYLTAGWYRTGDVTPVGAVADYVAVHGDGGWLAGAGAVVRRDTRDDAMGPRGGSLSTATMVFSDSRVAGAYTYRQFELDQRTYVSLGRRVVLAMEAYGRFVPGNVPLDELPALGGGSRLRGYFEGRFRDHLYLMAQAEARVKVWGRFSIAPFAGIGNVFPTLSAVTAASPKYAAGSGFRFSVKKERDLNIRLDLAKSPISSGVYVNLGEAF